MILGMAPKKDRLTSRYAELVWSGVPYEIIAPITSLPYSYSLTTCNFNGILLEFSGFSLCSQKPLNANTRISTNGIGPKKDRLRGVG